MTKQRKTKKEVKEYDIFKCMTCSDNPEFDKRPELIEHLKTVHNVTELTCKREFLMHVDGEDWFSSSYSWTIGGVKFAEECMNKRRGENARLWKQG